MKILDIKTSFVLWTLQFVDNTPWNGYSAKGVGGGGGGRRKMGGKDIFWNYTM